MAASVERWLESIGLAELADAFARNHIDFDLLARLTTDDLKELGLSIGQRRRFLDAVQKLDGEVPCQSTADDPLVAGGEAERRQLTVMFCDLAGSTALSRRLDPEELRQVNLAFQGACRAAIERYGGFVARYMGDGILAYFGYPLANEDDAERAVHAGLAVVGAVRALELTPEILGDATLATRVGIATGSVVVGDLIGEGVSLESAVVGDTPNLAARLQSIAGVDEVLVAEATRAVAGGRFDYQALGPQDIKGFAEPVSAWRVLSSSAAQSRFEAMHGAAVTPLVGRELELRLLAGRWDQARDGQGQVVLLTAEAGIGKSRLSGALREYANHECTALLHYQCSAHHRDSALHPVIEQLTRAARIGNEDSPQARLSKVEELLSSNVDEPELHLPLVASLLSVPLHGRQRAQEMTPEQLKEATLGALISQLEALAKRGPVLMVYEDVHWADATSLEFLALVVEHVQGLPVMVLVTSRPEFVPPWAGDSHVTSLTLSRFSRAVALEMIHRLTNGKRLPGEVCSQLLDKTDGVALFLEELTRNVLESGLLEDRGDHFVLEAPLPPLAIPGTLQDSLMARLDRLGPIREIAQVAAAMGRQFQAKVLAAVTGLPPEELSRALAKLVDAGLLFRRGTPPLVRYVFKHALVQDAAYGSLLKTRRRELHGRIADALALESGDVARTEPELLAHHYTEAGRTGDALEHWLAAGKRAAEQAAYAEAISHLNRGLSLLDRLPDGTSRSRREVALRVALGVPLMKKRSAASTEVGENYRRARRLCEELGDEEQRFPVLWGQWYHNMLRFEVREACALADELLVAGQSIGQESFEIEAHHCQWASRFLMGDPVRSLKHADEGLRLYRPEHHHPLMFVYGGHDPGVCACDVGALTLWLTGQSTSARQRMDDALRLAHKLGQSSTLANTLSKALTLAGFRCDLDAMADLGAQLLELTQGEWGEQSRPHALAALAWVDFKGGSRDLGLARMREAVCSGLLRDPWNIYLVSMIAMAFAHEGALDEALELVDESLLLSRQNHVHWWEPELFRVRAELLMRTRQGDPAEVRRWLERACEAARSQGASGLELRTAWTLARLPDAWAGELEVREIQGKRLISLENEFTAADLGEARAALQRLS